MAGVKYVDDPNIADSAELWRRLFPKWVVPDANTGGVRVSSAAFDDSTDGTPLSVLIAEIVKQSNRTAADVIAAYPGYGLAEITAGAVRSCGQGVMPTPDDDEPAHASVFGPKTAGNRKRMAKAAQIVIAPSG